MDPDQAGLSIEQVVTILRRRAVWIVLCLVVGAAAAFGFSKAQTKKYESSAALSFSNSSLSQQIAGLSVGGSSSATASQQATNLELAKLGDLATSAAADIGGGVSPAGISESVRISQSSESNILHITAKASSPASAAMIANAYAHEYVVKQRAANKQFLHTALIAVNRQLAKLSPAQRFGADGLDLQSRAHTLSLLSEIGYNNAELVQRAAPSTSPSSPRVRRNTAIGAACGLLLGLLLAFALERFDRRIREPEDLEAAYELPLIGLVPHTAGFQGKAGRPTERRQQLSPAEAEAMSLIRARLRFFTVEKELRSIVIASPSVGEGKSTVARHLAEAAARSGSHVLLIEADLRRPSLSGQLGLPPGEGLAGVLAGSISLLNATQAFELVSPPGEGKPGRTLDVLLAGALLPPNPGELIESHAMSRTLDEAVRRYDLVILDTPPLDLVSDAYPLLARVDGVVIVGLLGATHIGPVDRLKRALSGSGARLLGVVANGGKPAGSYGRSDGGAESSGDALQIGGNSHSTVSVPVRNG